MVKGIEIFKEYFQAHHDNYIIIGGTACDIVINAAGFTPRTTVDFDIVLIVEALSPEFVKLFWQFIMDGDYTGKQKNETARKYYRFSNPQNEAFPEIIELFARDPDFLDLDDSAHLTPVPVEEGLSDMSAILMDNDYYHFTIKNSEIQDGVNRANIETLICLKAKAYLENKRLKEGGIQIRRDDILKHKRDVFRLTFIMDADAIVEVPEPVYNDLKAFADDIREDLPDAAIFKDMNTGPVNMQNLFSQFLKNFNLQDNA